MPYTPPTHDDGSVLSLKSSCGKLPKLSLPLSELSLSNSEARDALMRFPIESTLSYSYAQLSPNSLALRISILRRSLELLIERPQLLGPMPMSPASKGNNLHRESNASCAALSALFRSTANDRRNSCGGGSPTKSQFSDALNNDLHQTLDLLDKSLGTDTSHISSSEEAALGLHELSLAGPSQLNALTSKLMHALATPFYESSLLVPIMSEVQGTKPDPSVSNPDPSTPLGRPFTLMSTSKKAPPQAVVTTEVEFPWRLKNANDLACLMFGVSKASLKSLTLLDLIAPRSRQFLKDKMSKLDRDIMFSGEIMAINPRQTNLAWASLWSKRKENMMVFIFDQVPCHAIDLEVKKSGENWEINSVRQTDKPFRISNHTRLEKHFPSVSALLKEGADCDRIRETRYFTLHMEQENLPCAITSTAQSDSEITLHIHSLSYIAGTFIISAVDFSVLSYNGPIAKNLFGGQHLLNTSIDTLLPDFTLLFQELLNCEPSVSIDPGLVLPEHLFRKLDAQLRAAGPKLAEQMFLESRGINARHTDGSIFKVDVQLRVSNFNSFVLWITYAHKMEEETVSSKSVTFNEKPSFFLHGNHSDHSINLPSQMTLLPENESDIFSMGEESSDGLSRSSSQKRVDVSRANSLRSSPHRKVPSLSHSSTGSEGASGASTPMKNEDENYDHAKQVADFELKNERYVLGEKELLKAEQENLKTIASKSKSWPEKVGSRRREKKFSEFKVLKNMGEGAYGKVSLCQNLQDPFYKVVIKLIIKDRILVDTWVRDRKLGTIPSEIQIMFFLNNDPHPNIMRLVDFFEDQNYYYLETPVHGDPPGIDLFDLIEIKANITEFECKYIFKQCCSAVNHLHKHGIVHRDIKDENIIVDNRGVVKLIDFGSAAYVKSGPFDVFVGTIDYAAPEVLDGKPYNGKPQDVWAMGILLYTLLYKENPFYNVDEILDGDIDVKIPFVVSDGSVRLIKKILQKDLTKRPTMAEILSDEWLVL